MKWLKWLKERFICLLGFHGYNNREDNNNKKCSYCGCHFEGWLPRNDEVPQATMKGSDLITDVEHEVPQATMKGSDSVVVMLSEIESESVKEGCIRVAQSQQRPKYDDTLREILFESVQAAARKKNTNMEDLCENKE